ncbi:MAG: class I SAM-dependent methyltransferase [Oscillospiraceae bacterium]|nr:class I SAM-dependent methyltransferase [Oscillospiraceae bacterium]
MTRETMSPQKGRPKSLPPRLLAMAQHIRPTATVIDVGTDHGYLPVFLAQQGHSGRLIACDIAEKPLAKARDNLCRRGLDQRVALVLCDGIPTICGGFVGAVDIVIAGMGGETIVGILQGADLAKSSAFARADVTLLLQPMSRAGKLEEYLQSQNLAWQAYEVPEGRRRYVYYVVNLS